MRLAVTSLWLSHFRSHRSLVIEPGAGANALHGPNGAGKTNLLEALSLLSPGRGLRRAAPEDLSRRPEAVGWKIVASVESLGVLHEIETWAEPGGARQVRIDGKAVPQLALGRLVRMVWLVPAMDRLWSEGPEGRRRFLDRVALSFEPSHGEAVLEYEKAMRDRNRLLRDGARDARWYAALEAQMAQSGATIRANRLAAVGRLMAAQDGAATSFPRAEVEVLDPGAERDLTEALAGSRPADLAAGRTLTGPHRADLSVVLATKGVAAELCSTGEQKALLLSLVLANARALREDFGAPPILLLDEVAAHLDNARRAVLYRELAALGAQVWMTGTGADLFEDLPAGSQRFDVTETGGLSLVQPRKSP